MNHSSEEMIFNHDLLLLMVEIGGRDFISEMVAGSEGVRGRNSDHALMQEVLGWQLTCSLEDGLPKSYP